MTCLVLFDDEDSGGADLAPLCDLRASFALRSGAVTTAERLARQLGQPVDALMAPGDLAALTAMRFNLPINRLPEHPGPFLFVNGRLTAFEIRPPHEVNTADVDEHGAVVAALLDPANARAFVDQRCRELPDDVDVEPVEGAAMLRRPWELLTHRRRNLLGDLQAMTDRSKLDAAAHPMTAIIGSHDVRVGRRVTIHPMTVFNASDGPIVIDDDAQVHAHSVVYGPCYIGPHTMLHHRTDVGGSAIGPWCKLGGEISGCIIQGHANKGHGGYLGDSYLGEWVNLGAATVTSNLKNTYGQVAMRCRADGPTEPTGEQFLGSIIGDHVKTAIGTRLLTGTCLGTGAMVALSSFAPRCVEPFAFLTDAGAQRYVLERFALVADRVMQRRGQRVTAELAHRFAQLMADR